MTIQDPVRDEDALRALREYTRGLPAPQDLRRRGRGTSTPTRKADHRLRGLDLGAPALAEVRPQGVLKSHPSLRRRRRRLAIQGIILLLLVAGAAAAARTSVVQPYRVQATAMVPNLQPGTDVLVVRPRALTGALKTGDIVVFHPPGQPACTAAESDGQGVIARVVARPGDTIWSSGDRIYLDGYLLRENGWYNQPFGEVGPTPIPVTTVPAGSYFVLGDNRTDTCDSRAFGVISSSSVVGRVVATTMRSGHPFLHLT